MRSQERDVDALPKRDHGWKETTAEVTSGLTIVPPQSDAETDYISFPNGILYENDCGYIIDGLEQFLGYCGDRELEIPEYYTRFSDFDTYVGRVSVRRDRYGFGITPTRLESAVRFATGGGHYNADNLTAIGCGGRGLVVRAPSGDYFIGPERLPDKPEGFDEPRNMAAGMLIEEEDNDILLGLSDLADDLAGYYGLKLDTYDHAGSGYHQFETSSGASIRLPGQDIAKYTKFDTDPSSLLGDRTYEADTGEEYSCTVNSLEYERGETIPNRGVCVGYQLIWNDPRNGPLVSLSENVTACVRYYHLIEQTHTDDESRKFRVMDFDTSVAEFESKRRTPLAATDWA